MADANPIGTIVNSDFSRPLMLIPKDGGIHCSIARLFENAYGFFLSGDSRLHFTTVSLSRIGTFAEKPEKSAFNSPISVTPGFPLITVNLHTVGAQSRFGTRKGRVPPQNLAPPGKSRVVPS